MAKQQKRIAGNPELDPTLPDTTLELGGRQYHLLFTYGALGIAERKLAAAGVRINLLVARSVAHWDASNLPFIFYAALVARQPEMTFTDADALLTFESSGLVMDKLAEAWAAAMPQQVKEKNAEEPSAAAK